MLLLVVPLVGLLAVGGYAMYNAVLQSRDAAELSGNAEVSLAAFGLVDALQAEREVLAQGKPTTEALRSAVTSATAKLQAKANAQGGELKAMTDRALQRSEAAGSLAKSGTGGLVAVDGYSPAIAALLKVSNAGFDPHGAIDAAPSSATNLLASAQEAGARERDLVRALSERHHLLPDVYSQVSQLAAAQDIQSRQAAAVAEQDLEVRIDRVGDGLAAASLGRDELFFGSITGAVADQATLDNWIAGADQRVANLLSLRNDAATRAVDAVDSLATSSRQVLLLAGAALLAMVLISAFLVRSAIRSIARPLTELAAQAEEVAMVRLPEAVKSQQTGGTDQRLPTLRATGASEVQEVAGAFNDVQDTALRLAGEQAVLRRNLSDALTNLGRRNQALLGRQLDFITSLEQRETDPAFLEHLFKLDHLASRMRRNAESLLILTGSETPRRRRKPAPLSEVVRAAMSEVEDFERVRMGSLGDATVTGPVVIDLVHMLAELVENSLRFSPPDSTVEIDGRSLGQGGYQLAVIDHGVGMADVELVAANQRLAGLDEVDGLPTRYLGQYVIAKLAAKTGAIVRLQPTVNGRGVTAVVSLPATATIGGSDRSTISQPLPGSRGALDNSADLFAPGAGLTTGAAQPDAVLDPSADPFAEPAPTRDDLVPAAPDEHFEDLSWLPEVPAADAADGGINTGDWGDDWSVHASAPSEPMEDAGPLEQSMTFEEVVSGIEDPIPTAGWASDEPVAESPAPAPGQFDIGHVATFAADPDAAGGADGGDYSQDVSVEEIAAAFPTPPPLPARPHPIQSWESEPVVPAEATTSFAQGAGDELAAETEPTPQPEVHAAAEPAAEPAVEPAAEPAVEPAVEPAAVLGGGLGGGLTRRVPGASLSDSPLGQPAADPVPDQERSADGVRSMLAAFQGGRNRGQGSVAVQDPGTEAISTTNPSTAWTADHNGVEETSELEDPRDH